MKFSTVADTLAEQNKEKKFLKNLELLEIIYAMQEISKGLYFSHYADIKRGIGRILQVLVKLERYGNYEVASIEPVVSIDPVRYMTDDRKRGLVLALFIEAGRFVYVMKQGFDGVITPKTECEQVLNALANLACACNLLLAECGSTIIEENK